MKRKILYILADLADRAAAIAVVCASAALYIVSNTAKIITAKPLKARREPIVTMRVRMLEGPTIINLDREAYSHGR